MKTKTLRMALTGFGIVAITLIVIFISGSTHAQSDESDKNASIEMSTEEEGMDASTYKSECKPSKDCDASCTEECLEESC